MVSKRKQTTISTEQPVRFYKFIALTFLFLTIILLGVIMFMSSKRTTVVIESKATPVDITDSVVIGKGDKVGSLKGEVSTTLVELNKDFFPVGTREEEAQATGSATIYNDSSLDQPLVATTRLLSPNEVLFRIKEGVTVPSGGSVEVEVYADKKGKSGNIAPATFTIPGLNSSRQKQVYAASVAPMSGGIRQVGILSAEDMKKAEEKLKELLYEKGKTELLLDNPEMAGVFLVIEDDYQSSAEIGDEIFEFSLKGEASVLGVFYNSVELQELARMSLLRRAVSDIELVVPSQEAPTVTIEDYDLIKNSATVLVFYDGVALLNPESKQLNKSMFFGKTKDEVRRYLLKLDHVRSVDIKFTPAWIRTVPHVSEHISIVVKEVR